MIDVMTLGAAELEERLGPTTRRIAVQPKRLALVAYLALAGGGQYRRRDSLVALFWPDLDDEHARGALRQALSYLRRTLGPSTVVTRGEEEIALAPDALRCDAAQFEEAVRTERLEAAMTMYRGDFLDGLFVSDASPELEQWIAAERLRLRGLAATCCRSLAVTGLDRGDTAGAVAWGRRTTAFAPDDEGILRWLITLFDSIGDRAAAVDAYEGFARRLAFEYSVEPSPETQALIGTVRNRSVAQHTTRGEATKAHTVATPAVIDTPATLATSVPIAPAVHTHRNSPRRAMVLVAIAIAVPLAAIVGSLVSRPPKVARGDTLAVLPIQDLAADTTQPNLADALTEQLITDIAQMRELHVINRRTMTMFRGSVERPRDVARALAADMVLIAAMQRMGDSVRLDIRLVRTSDDRTAWAWNTPVPRGDVLDLARDIADSVAAHSSGSRLPALQTVSGSPRRVDAAALDSYIRGRYWWDKRGRVGLLRSIELFTAALDHDPTFALAYSGMADAYVQLGYGSLLSPDDAFPKARAAAERALELDSTLAEPHATLGFVRMYYDWDWPNAERELRRAIELNPSYATGHEWYGLFLAAMGRFDEAREHERRAQALDPLAVAVAGTAAWVLYYAGRQEDAQRELGIALRQDSNFALGRFYLGRVYQARGQLDSALAEYRNASGLQEWVPTIAAVGHVYGTQGRRREAIATLARLDTLSHREYVTAYGVALVYAALGQRDSAFAWLDRGVSERTHWMVWLRRDPRWAPIRDDPRFDALARRLKLPR